VIKLHRRLWTFFARSIRDTKGCGRCTKAFDEDRRNQGRCSTCRCASYAASGLVTFGPGACRPHGGVAAHTRARRSIVSKWRPFRFDVRRVDGFFKTSSGPRTVSTSYGFQMGGELLGSTASLPNATPAMQWHWQIRRFAKFLCAVRTLGTRCDGITAPISRVMSREITRNHAVMLLLDACVSRHGWRHSCST